jgi:hypothetical protein
MEARNCRSVVRSRGGHQSKELFRKRRNVFPASLDFGTGIENIPAVDFWHWKGTLSLSFRRRPHWRLLLHATQPLVGPHRYQERRWFLSFFGFPESHSCGTLKAKEPRFCFCRFEHVVQSERAECGGRSLQVRHGCRCLGMEPEQTSNLCG